MQELAISISEIMYDYHNYNDFEFSDDHVLDWVKQFEKNDRRFILEELLYILNQGVYINEQEGRDIMLKQINELAIRFKYNNTLEFLNNVEFLDLQKEYKSQHFLLNVLDEILINGFGIKLKDCGNKSKKFAIYIDDILATGGTLFDCSKKWLELKENGGDKNIDKVINGEKIFVVSLFCMHEWGAYNVPVRLKHHFGVEGILNKFVFQSHYVIENHPNKPLQRFNLVYPIQNGQPNYVIDYFNNIDATYKAEYAFRKERLPRNETFFSSSTNRVRFENILLNKGVELITKKRFKPLERNQRPLGMCSPSNKLLGTGTMFFTWRNVSNTAPIVFWWALDNWYPLFNLNNRGL